MTSPASERRTRHGPRALTSFEYGAPGWSSVTTSASGSTIQFGLTPTKSGLPVVAGPGSAPYRLDSELTRRQRGESFMEYRPLGRTGVSVSQMCLGAMMFGAFGNPDHDDAVRIIHKALDAGINFI